MTLRDLIQVIGSDPKLLAAGFAVPFIAALVAGALVSRASAGTSPVRYLYTLIVYVVTIPGTLAAVLTAYALFFTRESLLDVNLFVYVLPIVAMIATLVVVGRNVDFAQVPGFDRLSGLITMLAVSFAIVLAISKLRIFVFFGGSIAALGALAMFVFALLKWGAHAAFRRGDEPRMERPRIPSLD